MSASSKATLAVLSVVRECVGADRVSVDPPQLAAVSADISGETSARPIAVIKPQSVDGLARAVAALSQAKIAIIPRGGGTTATRGALPVDGPCVVVDMSTLNKIVEINETDGYVTVEAGCTWAALNDALAKKGLRIPSFGPLMGASGTVGGGVSGHAGFFCAGLNGNVAEHVLSLDVILPDGNLLETGSAAAEGRTAFYRTFGPDFGGIFLGDSGAFGLKARVTLRLASLPSHQDFLSFAFERFEDVAEAHVALLRENVAAEQYSFDPVTNDALAARGYKALAGLSFEREVAAVEGGMGQKLATKSRTVIDGHRLVMRGGYSLHVVVEGRSAKDVELSTGRVRRVLLPLALKELPNSFPQALRANPFAILNKVVGAKGENRLALRGIFPLSLAMEMAATTDEYMVRHLDLLKQHNITVSWIAGCIANGFYIEPSFEWPDRLTMAHSQRLSDEQRAQFMAQPPNPGVRDIVARLRRDLAMLWGTFGAVYSDIGKFYPYASVLSSASLAFAKAIKKAIDPNNLMNPGALELGLPKGKAEIKFAEFPQDVLAEPFKFR